MENTKGSYGRKDRIKSYIFVIRQLASREMKHGNKGKWLGQLWNVITPVVSMLTMSILFAFVFKKDFRQFVPYVFTGTIMFGFYDSGMSGCLNALAENKNLMIRTKIPKNILVIEKLYEAFIRMLFSVVGYVIALIVTGTPVGFFAFLIPVDVFFSALIILGIGKILAVINVYFADISYFYKILMRFVFYASAIFYDADKLSPAMQQIIMFNPIYLSITFARSCILYNGMPSAGIWVRLIIYAVVVYVIGTVIFKKGSQDVVAKL